MKVKILKSKNETTWYKHFVDSEFEVGEYDRNNTRLPFKISGMGWVYESDCVITELPESFCVKSCDDGIKWGKYIQWLNKNYNTDFCGRIFNSDRPYYGVINDEGWGVKIPFGTEIHIDDMIKHIDYMESQQHINGGEQFSKESQLIAKMDKILKEETNMNTQKLSRKGLKEIHSVACPSWKTTLEHTGSRNPLEDYIELTQEEVDKMFEACTKEQLPIVSKYLKQDDGSVDLTKITVGQVNSIWLDGESIIEVRNRGEYKDKSLWLNDIFNWEIKKDSKGKLCLIPTKKK